MVDEQNQTSGTQVGAVTQPVSPTSGQGAGEGGQPVVGSGVVDSGAGQSGASTSGVADGGAGQSGASASGVADGGAGQSGASASGVAGGGAVQSGASTTSDIKAEEVAQPPADSSSKVISNGSIAVDKSKSAEQYIIDVEVKYIVPKLIREKFPDLIKLIYETESMDSDEREYWLQIMPIMTEDQIVKFRDILVNEKQQLEKLDKEYEAEMLKISGKHSSVLDEAKMKQRMEEIKQAEKAKEASEKEKEAELLEQLKNA